jgi:hypothetical protein
VHCNIIPCNDAKPLSGLGCNEKGACEGAFLSSMRFEAASLREVLNYSESFRATRDSAIFRTLNKSSRDIPGQ